MDATKDFQNLYNREIFKLAKYVVNLNISNAMLEQRYHSFLDTRFVKL